jgi:hypothetical protein
MKKVIRLTESDLVRLVKRVIDEQQSPSKEAGPAPKPCGTTRNIDGVKKSAEKNGWKCTKLGEEVKCKYKEETFKVKEYCKPNGNGYYIFDKDGKQINVGKEMHDDCDVIMKNKYGFY